jgi:hypothetical protein
MAMSDDGALGPAIGIDMKAAGPAIQTLRVNGQPRAEVIRSHCGTFVWNKSRFLLPILELRRVARQAVAKPCIEFAQKMQHSRYVAPSIRHWGHYNNVSRLGCA